MNLRRWILVPVLISGVVLAGCSDGSKKTATGGSTGAASAALHNGPVAVTIKNFSFGPSSFSIKLGQSITFTNQDDTIHTATVIAGQPGMYDSGNLAQGKSGTFTPTTVGTYNYICTIHQYMKGSFTVVK